MRETSFSPNTLSISLQYNGNIRIFGHCCVSALTQRARSPKIESRLDGAKKVALFQHLVEFSTSISVAIDS